MDSYLNFVIITTIYVAHGHEIHKNIDEQYQFRLSTDSTFSHGNSKNLFIRHGKLTLYCQLYDTSADPLWDTNLLVIQYKLQGFAPTVRIYNQTWSIRLKYPIIKRLIMDYKAKLTVRSPYWVLDIDPKIMTYGGSDAFVKEHWMVTVSMNVGKVMYRTNFILLDINTEPLLRPRLSPRPLQQSPITSDLEDIIIAHTLCVANIALVTVKRAPSADIYIGLTAEGFVSKSVQWFALAASTLCSGAGHNCSLLKVLDIGLTNYRVLVLTDHGLFYSEEMHKTSPGAVLTFRVMWKSEGCDIIQSGKVSFSGICQSRFHDIFRDDVVTVTYQCKNKETFGAFSRDNVESWKLVERNSNNSIAAIVHNYHVDTLNTLYTRPNGSAVLKVMQLKDGIQTNYSFPPFEFSPESAITGLIIHPVSCICYVFGKQLWLSEDGGNWFEMMYPLLGDRINKVIIGLIDGVIVAQTANRSTKLLYSKTGVSRVAVLNVVGIDNCTVYFDSFGDLYCIMSDQLLTAERIHIQHHIKEFKAYSDHPLVLQMYSPMDITFYEYSTDPTAKTFFYTSMVGQQISHGSIGSSIIQRLTFAPDCGRFLVCVHVKLIDPYQLEDVSAINCDLEVKYLARDVGKAILRLTDSSGGACTNGEWQETDLYKTVVIPQHTSFLITRFHNASHVTAVNVMSSQRDIKLHLRHWHLVNFGIDRHTGRSVWYIKESDCHHDLDIEKVDGHKKLFELDIDDKVHFSNLVTLEEPVIGHSETLVYATLSNPWLFNTDSRLVTDTLPVYSQNISFSIQSVIRMKGMTVVRFHIPRASLMCRQTSRLITVFAGCPTVKRFIYQEPIHISEEDFLHGNPLDENGIPLLKTLPPNYRPPSNEGVNIPLTDNIYNADPSVPRPVNVIHRSQESGKYKQCAGKADRKACQCTDAMRYSPTVNDTDCRERVYKLCFPGELKPKLLLVQLGHQESKLKKDMLVSVYEVNNRTPIITSKMTLLQKMIVADEFAHEGQFQHPATLSIVMKGTGLYHIRIKVVEGCSHCDLVVEFQVFIHSAPLAYPWEFIVNFIVTLLVGLLLAGSYLYYLTRTTGLVRFRPLDETPQAGYYPPRMLKKVAKEKAKTAVAN